MDFDTMLYRQLDDPAEFNTLIPKPNNTNENTGNGDTGFSISEMKEMVLLYNHQMQEVAKVLQADSLQSTVENVKDFVCYNFQYKADGTLQQLRSPSRAWQDREDGIDCKSYSIIASSILLQLGIVHYIRKIKQPGYEPTEFTHVYVVVPIDQQTGNLNKGYYTIDGTLTVDQEPEFIEAKDLYMNELPHARLNGAMNEIFSGESSKGVNFELVKSVFKIFTSGNFSNIFKHLDCLGGSAYSDGELKTTLTSLESFFNSLINDINQAVVANDMNTLKIKLADYEGFATLFVQCSELNYSVRQNYNSCSKSRMQVGIAAFKFYKDVTLKALDAWVSDNFIETIGLGFSNYSSDNLLQKYGLDHVQVDSPIKVSIPLFKIAAKPKLIPQFEITKYVADLSSVTGIDFKPFDYLKTLYNTAIDLTPKNANTGGINPNGNYDNGTGYDANGNANIPPTVEKAGFGVLGWVIVVAGLGFAFSQMKDKPSAKKIVSKTLKK